MACGLTEDGRPIFVYAGYASSPALCETPCPTGGQWIPLPAPANIDVDGQWRAVTTRARQAVEFPGRSPLHLQRSVDGRTRRQMESAGWRMAVAMQDGLAKGSRPRSG